MKSEKRFSNCVNVRFPVQNVKRLRKLADNAGVSLSDLVRAAILTKLADWESAGHVTLPRN